MTNAGSSSLKRVSSVFPALSGLIQQRKHGVLGALVAVTETLLEVVERGAHRGHRVGQHLIGAIDKINQQILVDARDWRLRSEKKDSRRSAMGRGKMRS